MRGVDARSCVYDPFPGPSGGVAGWFLAKGGAKVALLDKEHFPRDKICGDAVVTPALAILKEMGVFQELVDADEIKLADNGGFVSPSGLAYIGGWGWGAGKWAGGPGLCWSPGCSAAKALPVGAGDLSCLLWPTSERRERAVTAVHEACTTERRGRRGAAVWARMVVATPTRVVTPPTSLDNSPLFSPPRPSHTRLARSACPVAARRQFAAQAGHGRRRCRQAHPPGRAHCPGRRPRGRGPAGGL